MKLANSAGQLPCLVSNIARDVLVKLMDAMLKSLTTNHFIVLNTNVKLMDVLLAHLTHVIIATITVVRL